MQVLEVYLSRKLQSAAITDRLRIVVRSHLILAI